jgi:hypothetical protein
LAANPYPTLSALARDDDKPVLKSIRDWMIEYNEEDVQMVANDNDPTVKIENPETRIDAVDAMELIRSMAEDEHCAMYPDYERTTESYSADSHGERFERVKRGEKTALVDEGLPTEDAMLHRIHVRQVRQKLGRDAEILDMAVGPYTFRQIGEFAGYAGKYAERKGKEAVKQAAKNFEKLVS